MPGLPSRTNGHQHPDDRQSPHGTASSADTPTAIKQTAEDAPAPVDPATFMAHIPDDTPWQDLTLLGTHDSCAFYGFPISQCQQPATTVYQQLEDGVRYLDLRMRVIGDELIMYHGVRPQRATFLSVLAQIHTFLAAHPSESLLVSLKEEVPPLHPRFALLVWRALAPHVDQFWFLESRIPRLGEVRGRGMIMPRFPIEPVFPKHPTIAMGPMGVGSGGEEKGEEGVWDRGTGIDPPTWPDNRKEGFEFAVGDGRNGQVVRVQDWYGVPTFLSIPEKLDAVISHLEPTISTLRAPPAPPAPASSPSSTPATTYRTDSSGALTISYLSAASFPLAPPTLLAKGLGWPAYGLGIEGLNARLARWLDALYDSGHRVRAVVPCDFYAQGVLLRQGVRGLAEVMIAMNMAMESALVRDEAGQGSKGGGVS